MSPYSPLPVAPGVTFADDFGGPTSGFSAVIGYLPFWPVLVGGLYELYALIGSPTPYLYYFFIKQPIIVCDILVGYLLYRYVADRGSDKAGFVLRLWVFSPYNIILCALWGMFDAIPVFFVVLSLSARPGVFKGIWAGIATFAKSVPLIYSIPLSRGRGHIVNLAIALGIPLVATFVVLWLARWPTSIVGSTLTSTVAKEAPSMSVWALPYYLTTIGWISQATVHQMVLPGGYAWIVGVALVTILSYRWSGFNTDRGLVRSLLLITLTFLLLRGVVNEQYALYLFAPAVLDVALWAPQRRRLLFAIIATVLAFHLTNDVLLIRYATPGFPQAFGLEASIISAINPERDFLLFAWAMLYCALNAYYLVLLYKERHVRTEDVPLFRRAQLT